ncbi:MAG: hypothetical protein ACLRWN_19250 [Eisenbergiella sp.]|nr:hypothetical protein [Eisenbergiella sp. OF01-20]
MKNRYVQPMEKGAESVPFAAGWTPSADPPPAQEGRKHFGD